MSERQNEKPDAAPGVERGKREPTYEPGSRVACSDRPTRPVRGKLVFRVEFRVDHSWIADGFDIRDDSAAQEMLMGILRDAYGHELDAVVLARPDEELMADLRGENGNDAAADAERRMEVAR